MEFGILGPLEVRDDGRDLSPRRPKQRALLAALLASTGEMVSTDELIDVLWGDSPPATAATALHGHVSDLRKLLGSDRIETRQQGYRLRVEPDELDLARFERLLGKARTAADPEARATLLRDALALWRGEPLVDLRDVASAQPAITRLDALRLAALEEQAEVELHLGRHAALLPELEQLLGRHPLSERLRGQLMLALYRAGRQSEALRVYHEGRRLLAEELGIEPGSQLQALEQQILTQDSTLALPVAPRSDGPRQERKLVTVLVAELAPAGSVDPEDLERVAGPALERAQAIVERFGGTAERLFANALVGVFGAPRAHDDDAERAVRAALELRAVGADPQLQLRIGIEGGEALVTIDGTDVAITGKVLAMASQLQATAPLGAIVVGEATHRATADTIEYGGTGPASWLVERVRPATSSAATATPFVGRENELALLERAFARARSEGSVQLATVTAEPGGGKTRLVREFRRRLESTSEAFVWRQGRCPPYGEGVTYWAVGEIVKAQAGILESDGSEVSATKLGQAIEALEPDMVRRAWLERSLPALIGVEGATALGERLQAFAVWQQFLESIAAREPLVVVFEDIHWADEALLEFIDHLASHASGVPILVLCTARLELLESHPDWAGGMRNATGLALAPLSDLETGELLRSLLGHPAGTAMIRRAGGNPLFAHELALIVDRLGSEDSTAIPDSLQAVISARIDALPPELKRLAHDAAVVGEVFWSGALATMAGVDRAEIDERLSRLVVNDVALRRRSSSVARETEYSFMHVLVRDVAYGQIPRRDRVAKHRSAAEWIERLAGDRFGDHAELIAHHYAQALELATGLGDAAQEAELLPNARRFLALAGEHVQALDVAQAEQFYQRALDLTPAGNPDRGRLLSRLGDVAQYNGRLIEAEELCKKAIAELQAHGDMRGAAEAMVMLSIAGWRLARPDENRRRPAEEAIRILEQLPPAPELVRAYAHMATHEIQAGRAQACRDWSSKGLAVADDLGIAWLRNQPLEFLGIARFELGDLGGIDNIRQAIAIGLETGLSWETAAGYADLAEPTWLTEGPAAALDLKRTAAAFAVSRGLTFLEKFFRSDGLWLMLELGRWDEVLDSADDMVSWDRAHGESRVTMVALGPKARILAARGMTAEASELESDYLLPAQQIGDPQDLVPALASAASVRHARGDIPGAVSLIENLERVTRDRDPSRRIQELPLAARICAAGGAHAIAEALIPSTEAAYARGRHCVASALATLAEARGELGLARGLYAAVAPAWQAFGNPLEHAQARLGEARCLIALGRAAEAGPAIAEVLQTGEMLGAPPITAAADALR